MLLDIPVIPVSFAYNNTTQLPAGVMDATASREMSSMGVLHARTQNNSPLSPPN